MPDASCQSVEPRRETCQKHPAWLMSPEAHHNHKADILSQGWIGRLNLPVSDPMKGWMMAFARANPSQGNTKYELEEKNAGGALARPLAMPGPESQFYGSCQDCPGLH